MNSKRINDIEFTASPVFHAVPLKELQSQSKELASNTPTQTCRLSGLSPSATLLDIKASFLRFGAISNVSLKVNAENISKGIATIKFVDPSSVSEAIKFYDNKIVDGERLSIVPVYAPSLSIVGTSLTMNSNETELTRRPQQFIGRMVADKVEREEIGRAKSASQWAFKPRHADMTTSSNKGSRLHPNHTLRGANTSTANIRRGADSGVSMYSRLGPRRGDTKGRTHDIDSRLGSRIGNTEFRKNSDVLSRLGSKIRSDI